MTHFSPSAALSHVHFTAPLLDSLSSPLPHSSLLQDSGKSAQRASRPSDTLQGAEDSPAVASCLISATESLRDLKVINKMGPGTVDQNKGTSWLKPKRCHAGLLNIYENTSVRGLTPDFTPDAESTPVRLRQFSVRLLRVSQDQQALAVFQEFTQDCMI